MNRLIAAGALAACGLASAAPAADYPKLNLNFAHFLPRTVTQTDAVEWWADELKGRSGGQINVSFFWSQSLAKANGILQMVAAGGVEAG